MKHQIHILASALVLASTVATLPNTLVLRADCPSIPSPFPTWQQLPKQSTLPDPFLYLKETTTSANAADLMAGRGPNRVKTAEEWYQCRRPEILDLLQRYQFGYYPDTSQETTTGTRQGNNNLAVQVSAGGKSGSFSATVQLPSGASASKPAPVVMNIGGMANQPYISAGIAVVTINYMQVAPDSNAKTGAFWSLYNGKDIGVLTAWAWGFHRTLDALNATYPEIDAGRVGVTGCSRLGKAALAAGLLDERVTLTMPMSAGIQGTGPYRYHALSGQDETLENSKQGAPWWTAGTLSDFVNHSENLPYDAHTIVAALAPRAVVMDQGTGDAFTNSKGTAVLVYPAAKAVYDWLGVGGQIGMSVRSGAHCDNSGYSQVLPFAQKIFFNQTISKNYDDLSAYGGVMTSGIPWLTASPPK